jgi:hypothetical protein
MKFLYQRFKARKGQKVQVDFSQPTKVKLLGSRDFDSYRKCRTNTYVGGKYDESPAIFQIPTDGEWVAVIEKGPASAPIEVEGKVILLGDDDDVQITNALDAPEPIEILPAAKVKEIEEEVEDADEITTEEEDSSEEK